MVTTFAKYLLVRFPCGSVPSVVAPAASPFGAAPAAGFGAAAASPFGAAKPAGGGLFGAAPAASPFGAPAPAAGGLFGAPPATPGGFGGGGFGAGATGTGQPPFQVETEHDATTPGGATKFSYHSITKMAAYQVWAERTRHSTPSPKPDTQPEPESDTEPEPVLTRHRPPAQNAKQSADLMLTLPTPTLVPSPPP